MQKGMQRERKANTRTYKGNMQVTQRKYKAEIKYKTTGYFTNKNMELVLGHEYDNKKQTEDFLEGFSRQIFIQNEFIDRPLDISYTIDELERRNDSLFSGKLDLKNVLYLPLIL